MARTLTMSSLSINISHTLGFVAVVLLMHFPFGKALGQDCNSKITQAQNLYDGGQFKDVVDLLQDCVKSKDREIRWQANRLVAMGHLGTYDDDLAKEHVIRMMEIHPEYKGDPLNDPNDLIYAIKQVTIIPRLSLGLGLALGTNVTNPKVSNVYMVQDQETTYKGVGSTQFAFSGDYQFSRDFAISIGASLMRKRYNIEYSFGNWEMEASEKLTYMNFPVSLRYMPPLKTAYRPYVFIGGYGGMLLASTNSFTAKNNSEEVYSLERFDSKVRRTSTDAGWLFGLGAFRSLGKGEVYAELTFLNSSVNITNSDYRYRYEELVYSYYYLDDDLRLPVVSVSIGYRAHINYRVLKN